MASRPSPGPSIAAKAPSPSPASHKLLGDAAATGRPSLWTQSTQRQLACLYVYTTLPLTKILDVVHRESPADVPGADSANKKLSALLGKEPRWLRPKSSADMARRLEQLALSPSRRTDKDRLTHSSVPSARTVPGSLPQELERERRDSPTIDDISVDTESVESVESAPIPGPPEHAHPHDTDEAVDDSLFKPFLRRESGTRSPSMDFSTSSLKTILPEYSKSYRNTVRTLIQNYTQPPAPGTDGAPGRKISSKGAAQIENTGRARPYDSRPFPLPGDFLNIDASVVIPCGKTPDHDYRRCLCAAAVEINRQHSCWVTSSGFTKRGKSILESSITAASLGDKDAFGNTIMHLFAARGDASLLEDSVDILCTRKPKLLQEANTAGQTFLHVMHAKLLARPDFICGILKKLSRFGVDIYARDHFGRNISHMMRLNGVNELQLNTALNLFDIQLFANRDAFTEPDPSSALTIERLNVPPEVDVLCESYFSILSFSELKLLLQLQGALYEPRTEDSSGRNGLHCLAYAKLSVLLKIFELLQVQSSDEAVQLKRKKTSPDFGSSNEHTDSHSEVLGPKYYVLSHLLARKVDCNTYDYQGNTPLLAFVAELSEDGNKERISGILSLLIRSGANIDARNSSGETALHIAARCGNKLAVRTLVEQGANVHARDAVGRSVLDVLDVELMRLAYDNSQVYVRMEACRAWLSGDFGRAVQSPSVLMEWGQPPKVRHTGMADPAPVSSPPLPSRGAFTDDIASSDFMKDIGELVHQNLRGHENFIESAASQELHRMSIALDWTPLDFFVNQEYPGTFHDGVTSTLTLTGTASDAQALTVRQYLAQTWPGTGDEVAQILSSVPSTSPVQQKGFVTELNSLAILYLAESVQVTAVGREEALIHTSQIFAWLGAALRSAPTSKGVYTCSTAFLLLDGRSAKAKDQIWDFEDTKPRREARFAVKFNMHKVPRASEQVPGTCWHEMFSGATLVEGFPVSERKESGLGLETPLNVMAQLAGSRRVTEFDGRVFLKGYSTMLVATRLVGDLLVWHYHYDESWKRISYTDHNIEVTGGIGLKQLQHFRHVVGWCSECKYLAGASDAKYDVAGTGLPRPTAGCFLEKVSISAGNVVSGGATFIPGIKESPPHLVRNGTISKLKWLSTKYVVFWDEQDKRGWLVNGTSALLHLVRASLRHYKHDDFSSCFLFDEKDLNNWATYKPNAAIRVLIDDANRALPVYPGSVARGNESGLASELGQSSTARKEMGCFLFDDLVDQHVTSLEQMIDHHSRLAGREGINLKIRARKHLEGWDFVELATDHDPSPRVATIPAIGRGWVDFVRSIGAITLFGRGFGDLIEPIEFEGMCPRWKRLPTGKYLLAASVVDLENIMSTCGNAQSTPRRLASDVLWHSPSKMDTPCTCQEPEQARKSTQHVDPVQILWPKKSARSCAVKDGYPLEEDGAVVFGHNLTLGYRWPEFGGSEVPVKKFPVTSQERLPVSTSAIAASDDSRSQPDADEAFTQSNQAADTAALTGSDDCLAEKGRTSSYIHDFLHLKWRRTGRDQVSSSGQQPSDRWRGW